jgi:hypothetical protein
LRRSPDFWWWCLGRYFGVRYQAFSRLKHFTSDFCYFLMTVIRSIANLTALNSESFHHKWESVDFDQNDDLMMHLRRFGTDFKMKWQLIQTDLGMNLKRFDDNLDRICQQLSNNLAQIWTTFTMNERRFGNGFETIETWFVQWLVNDCEKRCQSIRDDAVVIKLNDCDNRFDTALEMI